ncbi:MAG TPA: NAD(P)/FAD-dependent oxidoreductase [Nitrososphaerales archaeon]|nr:NAD(P)/FAD-dependent oxidoreductase [Nitrososphaerales archaeon]
MAVSSASPQFDLVVVGSGPGGCTAAKCASEQGLKTLLLEKKAAPGRKLCAGGIIGKVIRKFDIDDEALECHIDSYRFYAEREGWVDVPSKGAATSYRTTMENDAFKRFDSYLAARARDSGATLLTSSEAANLRREAGLTKVQLRTPTGEKVVTTRLVIGADGFHSTVGRLTGLTPPVPSEGMTVAVQREVITGKETSHNCLHLFDPTLAPVGYLWVYPKSRGYTIGVGCLASHIVDPMKFMLAKAFQSNGLVKEFIPPGSTIMPLEGAPIPAAPLGTFVGDGVMLVGDAAGQCDPVTGDGIYYAMSAGKRAAITAAEAVSKGDYSQDMLRSYEKAWNGEEGKELSWQRRRLKIISKNYVGHFERRIAGMRNPRREQLVRRTDYYLSRMTSLIPAFLLEKLVQDGYIL